MKPHTARECDRPYIATSCIPILAKVLHYNKFGWQQSDFKPLSSHHNELNIVIILM